MVMEDPLWLVVSCYMGEEEDKNVASLSFMDDMAGKEYNYSYIYSIFEK